MSDDLALIIASMLRLATPLAFAALGEYMAEKSGTINISIEGMMLGGAFGGIYAATITDSASLGLVAGIVVGVVIGLVHANFSHRLSVNTYVVGLTINLLMLGLTSFLLDSLELGSANVDRLEIPGLSSLPIIGQALFNQRWPAYLLWLLIPLTWYLINKTRWGLEMRAVGENPGAADATGVDVLRKQRSGLYVVGALAGLGGAYLSVGEVGTFNQNMTDGRGFIVIAAVIFGGWTLKGTVIGCLLFGATDSLRLALPALGVEFNSQVLIASPYVIALLAMMFFARNSRAPATLGRPFERGLK